MRVDVVARFDDTVVDARRCEPRSRWWPYAAAAVVAALVGVAIIGDTLVRASRDEEALASWRGPPHLFRRHGLPDVAGAVAPSALAIAGGLAMAAAHRARRRDRYRVGDRGSVELALDVAPFALISASRGGWIVDPGGLACELVVDGVATPITAPQRLPRHGRIRASRGRVTIAIEPAEPVRAIPPERVELAPAGYLAGSLAVHLLVWFAILRPFVDGGGIEVDESDDDGVEIVGDPGPPPLPDERSKPIDRRRAELATIEWLARPAPPMPADAWRWPELVVVDGLVVARSAFDHHLDLAASRARAVELAVAHPSRVRPAPYFIGPRDREPSVGIDHGRCVVDGDAVDPRVVRRYVKRRQAVLDYCYAKALLLDDPTLAGEVYATFRIRRDGTVASSRATGSSQTAACIAHVIRDIQFPKVATDVDASCVFTLRPPR